MKSKLPKDPKKGVIISIFILVIILSLLAIVRFTPNSTDKIEYGLKIEGPTPLWKIICYVIIAILVIAECFINRKMCRCPNCHKYISMNINMEYCPYCSENLDKKD